MPNGNFNILGPLVVCVGATETYNAPYVPGSQYTWTLIDPSAVTTILPYNTPPYIQSVTFSMPGNYTLICNMVNDILDCEGADTIIIKMRPNFSIFGPTSVCVNNPPTFFRLLIIAIGQLPHRAIRRKQEPQQLLYLIQLEHLL